MIMSSWILQGSLYLFSLFLFFLGSGVISVWIFMELNLLFFLFFMFALEKTNSYTYFKMGLFYFLIQSLGSFFFMLFVLLSDSFLFYSLNEAFLLMSMAIKIGLFPLSFWVYEVSSLLSSASFFFLLTLQKIPYFLVFFSFSAYCEFLCFLAFVMGSQMVFFSRNLDSLLISSSISSVIWIFFLFMESEYSFFFFFFVYSVCFSFLFFFKGLWRGFKLGSMKSFLVISSLFMFFLGLPPFSLFIFKLDIIYIINFLGKDLYIIFFSILSVMTLCGYFKIFFKDLILLKFLYGFKSPLVKPVSYLFFSIVPFILVAF